VRHGHISTLHIWPARRPLAAARAALIATLLPDPGTPEERKKLLEKLGGKVVQKVEGDQSKEETVGGILHWGRESSPDLAWFREEIRKAYGGRAPRVLDPFAGGGAIPLEGMRLGCEVTAIDINPVAWFILKCTLEYPQRLAGQKRPLPAFVREAPELLEALFKAQGYQKDVLRAQLTKFGASGPRMQQLELQDTERAMPEADLAWQVRAWGWWVLQRAKADLARFYPKVDGKPTVAYLWARTVTCKHCRATLPLLKTRWLCKKEKKRVVLTMTPTDDKTDVVFGIQNLSEASSNVTPKKTADKDMGKGTMSRSGATCPCCNMVMTTEDIRLEGQAGRLGSVMTAVVMDGPKGKEYRLPIEGEITAAMDASTSLEPVFAEIPFGLPEEPVPQGASRTGGGSPFTTYIYGLTRWCDLFIPRQLLALGTFVKHTRAARQAMLEAGYSVEWVEAVGAYLALSLDRVAERNSSICHYDVSRDSIAGTFQRYALPINWDFAEAVPISATAGSYDGQLDWVSLYIKHALDGLCQVPNPSVIRQSATVSERRGADVVVTDPPYYDAIPYSDLMDFFYVWLRRALNGLSPAIDAAFSNALSPKWDHEQQDGELIDDASRFEGDKARSKAAYEDGMARAFQACHAALAPDGRLVIVFAHKQPDAWETLVSAIIRAGFVVDGSWPIQTEMGNRTRALASAALSSSVWLVCKKRAEAARPGWDNRVLEEMREKITTRLRDFWDAGIRGPDFVWAATGPAMEAYSQYPVVKKANEPGQIMSVSEFLRQVRRMVVDFVVGRVLTRNGDTEAVSGLDDLTTYYLLHRHDFGLEETPIGPCILYAISCGLSDSALVDRYDLLVRTGGKQAAEEEEEAGENTDEADTEASEGSGSKVKLKPWKQRKRAGFNPEDARPIPLIDQTHRLMHLWRAGDVTKVDDYLEMRGLRRNALFHHLLQSLIELAPAGSEERSLLESISNHLAARSTHTISIPTSVSLWSEQARSEEE
jgi:adenine-specific DNA methylase